jgi:tyrosine-protein kinase Etk/Wzc
MEQQDQIKEAVHILWNRRRSILSWTAMAILLAAGLSLLLKNYYKATTIFYPASQDLAKPDQIFGHSQRQLEFYGTGEDLDRLLTVCAGNELKDQLVAEFDLYTYYRIDSSKNLARFKIRKKLHKLMEVSKTQYDAIELSLEDTDRSKATLMANRAREIVNQNAHALITRRLQEMAQLYEKSIQEKTVFIQTLSDSLGRLRQIYPIYDIKTQAETLGNLVTALQNQLVGERARYEALKGSLIKRDTLLYIAARIKVLESQVKNLEDPKSAGLNLRSFNEGVARIAALESAIERTQGQVNEDKIKYQNTLNTIQSGAHAVITVSAAELPDYKSRPKRSLLVVAAGLLTLITMSLYYLMKHYFPFTLS